MRISLSIVGLLMLIHAAWGKRLRYELYDVDDDSDIELDRRTGRIFEAFIGMAFIIGAILFKGHE